jgi:hypothetical protein
MRGMMEARGYQPHREPGEAGVIRFDLPLATAT